MHIRSVIAIAVALLMASPAIAQDADLEPTYGTVRLSAGFTPDPRVIDVVAGGETNAMDLQPRCTGFIGAAPDVRLVFSAGGDLPLIISADPMNRDLDTTLVIKGPDGAWYCDDDSGVSKLNPSIRWRNPQSGVYDIWVGSYRPGPIAEARTRLYISEVRSQ